MRTIKRKNSKSKKITLAITIAILAFAGYALTAHSLKFWPFQENPSTAPEQSGVNTVNYDPPTEEEIEQSQSAKDKIIQEEEYKKNNPDSDSKKSTVNVGISYADVIDSKLEVRAFTGDIIEGSGSCVLKVSKGSKTLEKTNLAFIDATSTICRPFYIPVADLSQGEWIISVNYNSNTSSGSSGERKVNIK